MSRRVLIALDWRNLQILKGRMIINRDPPVGYAQQLQQVYIQYIIAQHNIISQQLRKIEEILSVMLHMKPLILQNGNKTYLANPRISEK